MKTINSVMNIVMVEEIEKNQYESEGKVDSCRRKNSSSIESN